MRDVSMIDGHIDEPKGMSDNDIIKALECCKYSLGVMCKKCPSKTTLQGLGCRNKLSIAALDLINRQKADIERLQKEGLVLNKTFMDFVNKHKAEAIKEFAERLKNEIISDTAYGCDCNQHSGYYDNTIKIGDIPEYIDNLVKEMVGDNE